MVFHVHFSNSENSGEIRRIRNIDENMVALIDDEVIEIAFVSAANIFKGSDFVLSRSVRKKYCLPQLPLSFSRSLVKRLNVIWCSLLLLLIYFMYKPKTVVCEYSIGYQALKFIPKHIRCIVDVHAAVTDEYLYKNGMRYDVMAATYDYLEKNTMARASRIVCQSMAMKHYLLNKYDFLSESIIYPYCCNASPSFFFYDETLRANTRKFLGIGDSEIVFIYAGGLHSWQKVPESIKLFSRFCERHGKSKMIILSLDVHGVNVLIDNICPRLYDSFIVKTVRNDDVCKYLNAADIAFLLRDDVVMNQVASPTKLAEYMSCGLPIISSSVSRYWVNRNEFVFNIDERDVSELECYIKSEDRHMISEYARQELSLEKDNREIHRLLRDEYGINNAVMSDDSVHF